MRVYLYGCIKRALVNFPCFKFIPADKLYFFKLRVAYLNNLNDKRVLINKVPRISFQLAFDVLYNPPGPVDAKCFVPGKVQSEQMVKPDKMVYVGMGNKHMADLEKFTRMKAAYIPEVKKQGLLKKKC